MRARSTPLGCVVIWRRLADVGDATAPAAVLGGRRSAYVVDTPAGPTLVAVAAVLFTVSATAAADRRAR